MLYKKKLRQIACLIAVLILAFSLYACGAKEDQTLEDEQVTSQPFEVQGNQLGSGGTTLTNINAKTMTITPVTNGADIKLQFVLGSKLQNVDEAEIDKVPLYKAAMIEHPARLVLEFESVDFWDYDRTIDISDEDDLFYGIFKQIQTLPPDENGDTGRALFRIIFQLRKDVDAAISDKGNEISIEFRVNETAQDVEKFYIMSTETQNFSAGELNAGSLFPSLSSDLNNQLLISAPFSEEKEAQAEMDRLLSENRGFLNAQNTFLIALEGNSLPGFALSENFKAVYSRPIIRRNGVEETLPVIMPDGVYLNSTDDGSVALYAKTIYNDDGDNTQELWIVDSTDKFKRLTEIEFGSISHAAFSPDGKKLALLEFTADSSFLYIYDMETSTLDNLGEEYFGSTTSAFIWDSLGTAVYAITGNEHQQLLKYDFTMTDESMRVSAVEEQEIGEGDLGYYNGEIYFTNVTDDDKEIVYRIKPEGGLRTEFATGGSFRIAQNGEYMAIMQSVLAGGTTAGESTENTENAEETGEDFSDDDFSLTTLVLKNMITGEETPIAEKTTILSYNWASDNKLYYTERISEDYNDEYSCRLMSYDAETNTLSEIAELTSSDFATTPDPNVIYIPLISNDDIMSGEETGEEDADGEQPESEDEGSQTDAESAEEAKGGVQINATYRFRLDSPPPAPAQSSEAPENTENAEETEQEE